jgi:pimeloyl-ACP methyl ester carboxylesterase
MTTHETIGDAPDDDAGGPERENVYLLHGLLGTCFAHFAPQIRAWRERYRIIALDLPGHGRSRVEANRPYYATAIKLLETLMESKGPGHVIGLSYLGGSIALRCALARSDLFHSLVLSGYVPSVPHAAVSAWAAAFFGLSRQNPTLAADYQRLHGDRWQHTLDVVSTEIREEYTTAIAVTEQMIADLDVTTLLLNGSLRTDERMAAAAWPQHNPLIEGGIIPGAGHIASNDQPNVFNMIVERFWARTRRHRIDNHAPSQT